MKSTEGISIEPGAAKLEKVGLIFELKSFKAKNEEILRRLGPNQKLLCI